MSEAIQWDAQLMNCMMFLYHTRKCPLHKKATCQYGHLCFDSHDQIQRRRPFETYNGMWNYDVRDLCTLRGTKYQDNKCPNYPKRCNKAHTTEELNYHPTEYKMRRCGDKQFKETGVCSRGPKCWEWHDQTDNRNGKYINKNINEIGLNKGERPPNSYLRWADSQLANMNGNGNNQQQQQPQTQSVNNDNNNNNPNGSNRKLRECVQGLFI